MKFIALWWLIISVLGWLMWPVIETVLRATRARGWALAKILALLLIAYLFWLGNIVGLWHNELCALIAVVVLCVASGSLLWIRRRRTLLAQIKAHRPYILLSEALFLVLFLVVAWHRAYDPAIHHTEQLMDYTMLASILHAQKMPPQDLWLSGMNVSYYYLGYLTVGVMTRLVGCPVGVGYNLGLAHTLALAVIGAFELVYELAPQRLLRGKALVGAAAGATAVIIAGNLEGLVEVGHSLGWFGAAFSRWLGVPGLADAPITGGLVPDGNWWWWRASRIIRDTNFLGHNPTVITEFPIFSFILGDLHPHYMALPYDLLGLGMIIALYRSQRHGPMRKRESWTNLAIIGWTIGALGFVNSWDLPIYLGLALVAWGIACWQARAKVAPIIWIALWSILPYLPFYATLDTQVRGIGLLYYAKTPLKHGLLFYGLWLLPIAGWAVVTFERMRKQPGRVKSAEWWAVWAAVLMIPGLCLLLTGGWGRFLLGLIPLITTGPWFLLAIGALLAWFLLDLWHTCVSATGTNDERVFVTLMMIWGLALIYAVEYVYVRDVFETRMNTVFKVYYQAWLFLGLAAVVSLMRLWQRGIKGRVTASVGAVLLALCCFYGPLAGWSKTMGYTHEPNWDGMAYVSSEAPDEYAAARWLAQHAGLEDLVIQAPGEDYVASTSRMAVLAGLPTILGWPGHEIQWRGEEREVMRRQADLEVIYTADDSQTALDLCRNYGATWLYVGPWEIEYYGLDEGRSWFEAQTPAFVSPTARIYRISDLE